MRLALVQADLHGIGPHELAARLGGSGRAASVWACLRRGEDPLSSESITPALRARLTAVVAPCHLREQSRTRAADKTLKLLLSLADGRAVETVLIPTATRTTLCVSSQVGCARGCTFCLTATMGLVRNLTAAEIVAQLHFAIAAAASEGLPAIRNVVFMGMGEPLDNLEAVRAALDILVDARGYALGPRHITVSTVGPSPAAVAKAADLPGQLAWSLHSADDATRVQLVPTQRHDVRALLGAFAEACAPRKRPLFVELTLLHEVNDSLEDADRVAELFAEFPTEVRFNLLPMNPIPTSGTTASLASLGTLAPHSDLRPSAPERVRAFAERLRASGAFVRVRSARGEDERSACGQLAVLGLPRAASRS